MAALGRQVCSWRLARVRPAPARPAPARPRPLATASGAAGRRAESRAEPAGRDAPGEPTATAGPGSEDLRRARRRLLDMGFPEGPARDLLRVRPATRPGQLLDVVCELLLLGLHPEPACRLLSASPQLLTLPGPQLRRRAGYLRKLGLSEGKLRRLLQACPEALSMPQRALEQVVALLRERCLFTTRQVTQVLHRCPHVLREDPQELEYKFQYAYFRMGIKQADVVKTDFLQYPIAKIRQRHVFLERLGRYQTPDKKGQAQVSNPKLRDILRVSEAEFLARTALSSAEEFAVFKKLLAREEEEDFGDLVREDGDVILSEEEEGEEEEEEEEDEQEL